MLEIGRWWLEIEINMDKWLEKRVGIGRNIRWLEREREMVRP